MATMADKTIKNATRLRKIELSTREIIRISTYPANAGADLRTMLVYSRECPAPRKP